MAATCRPVASPNDRRSTHPVRGATVDERLAARWGCEPKTAHGIRHRERNPLARVIDEFEVLLALKGAAAAMAFVQPLLQRVNVAETLPDIAELDAAEEDADLLENIAQEQWRRSPTPANARALAKASETHRYHSERRDAALLRSLPS
jgi:hypothetical protein